MIVTKILSIPLIAHVRKVLIHKVTLLDIRNELEIELMQQIPEQSIHILRKCYHLCTYVYFTFLLNTTQNPHAGEHYLYNQLVPKYKNVKEEVGHIYILHSKLSISAVHLTSNQISDSRIRFMSLGVLASNIDTKNLLAFFVMLPFYLLFEILS